MNAFWAYFWPPFAAGLVVAVIAGAVAFRRPRQRIAAVAIGVILSIVLAAVWHGPLGAAGRFTGDVERTIREELTKARPNFGLLMEESGAIPGSDPDHTWIVDPLDGTTNFLHGLPHFSAAAVAR